MRLLTVFLLVATAAFTSGQLEPHGYTRETAQELGAFPSIPTVITAPAHYEYSQAEQPVQYMAPRGHPLQQFGIPYGQQQQQLGVEYGGGAVGTPIQKGLFGAEPEESKSPLKLATDLMTKFILNTIHHYNNLEINTVKEARDKISTPSVINLADTLERDHTANQQAVQEVATELGVELYPFTKNTVEVAMSSELGKLSGKEFELGWVGAQFGGHQLGIANMMIIQGALRKYQSKHGVRSDPHLMGLMGQTLQQLVNHRDLSYQVLKELTGGVTKPKHGSSIHLRLSTQTY